MTQFKRKGDLFSVKVKKDPKGKKRKIKKQDGNDITVEKKQKHDHLSGIDAQPLTYKTLTVGQLLLGCISVVRDYELVVSLPHKLVGSVSLAHISRPYTALLSKLKDDDNEEAEEEIHALQDLFQPGQYVVTSVVSIEKINTMTKVSLTLMPNEVNFGISASHLETGLVLPCAVASVEDKGYAIDTGISGIKGAFLKKENTDMACTLGVGSVLQCIITNIFGSDTKDNIRLTLSADPKAVSSATLDLRDTANVALLLPGTAVNTTISKIRSDAITLMLADLDGIVSSLHLTKPFDQLKQYSLGDSVRARVLYIMPLSKVVHFTLQKSICSMRSATDPMGRLEIGSIIQEAEIYKSSSGGIYVRLNSKSRGYCSGNHLSDKNTTLKHITRDFPVGKKMMCRLLKYNHMDQLFIVSFQKSVLEQQFVAYSELKAGQTVEATITEYNDFGARLAVSKLMSGHVPTLHLTNKPMKHPERKHAVGDSVTARVLKVNPERHHLILTLKNRLVKAKEPILTEYTQESENMVTVGYIFKIMPSGLLIGMFNDVKGFAPKSQVGVKSTEDLSALFHEGQVVRCRVLKVHPEKKRITLSLCVDDAKALNKVPKSLNNVEMQSRLKCVVKKVKTDVIQEPEASKVKEDQRNEFAKPKPCLTVSTGFVWDVPDVLQNTETSEASESEDEELSKKKEKQLKKSDRVAVAQEEERRLHQLELSRLEENQTPQSALEFEALLQSSPNSSAVWIQFISFYLESAEVDKAKTVAQRALQVIDAQEEEERLNIWTVLLRLEVLYGSPETVAEAYKEALVTNDQLKIHLAMAMVYTESNKIKEAEKVYFNVTRKFSQELSVWVKAGIFFFTNNMVKEGRHYLDRALHSLDKKDHVELINRFGQLEFRFGEMERGRTMFESLLSTYWKRMDIWGVYVDLLTKRKDIEGARHVLERMTGLKLRLRKMRFVFKKFLDFEKEHGTPQSVETVKQRVEEFVAATLQ